MARYRKIACQMWNDERFRSLSDSAKLVFVFMLTHQNLTSIGAMRATIPGMAAELGWSIEGYREAFQECSAKGMVKYDERASFVALLNFLKHNPPENPNVVKSWASQLELIPECSLKVEFLQRAASFVKELGEGFAKALPKEFSQPFPKGMPNPEPEPEPELQVGNTKTSLPSKAVKEPAKPRSGSGKGFDSKDLRDPAKIIAYAQQRGIDTSVHENRVRSLAAALESEAKGDAPGAYFKTLIDNAVNGTWTVSDEFHEPAKRWLRSLEASRRPMPAALTSDSTDFGAMVDATVNGRAAT